MDDFEGLTEEQIESIQKSRRRVIESIGKNIDLYGVTLSIGHLYGNMYFDDHPVTLDEMGEKMGMSKTSMSTGMRTLLDLKMVERVWEKGARKDLYEVVPDWYQNFTDYFSIKWRKAVESNVHSLKKSLMEMQSLRNKFPEDDKLNKIISLDLEKINDALQYYRWLDMLIETFETGEIFNFIPKPSAPDA